MTVKELTADFQNLKLENVKLWVHCYFTEVCNKINESTKFSVDSGKEFEKRMNDVETKIYKLS